MIEASADGFYELETDLRRIPADFPKRVGQVVSKGAYNIKKDWKDRWSGHAHIPALPRAITYDLTVRARDSEAEIGPDKAKRQGPLGNIIEFGTENNAPIPGGLPALAAEEPKFVNAIADLAEGVLADGRGRSG